MKIKVDTTKLNESQEYDLTVDLELLAEYTSLEVKPIYANNFEWEPHMPLGYLELKGTLAEADYAALEDTLDRYSVDYTFEITDEV